MWMWSVPPVLCLVAAFVIMLAVRAAHGGLATRAVDEDVRDRLTVLRARVRSLDEEIRELTRELGEDPVTNR